MPITFHSEGPERTNIKKILGDQNIDMGSIKHDKLKVRFRGLSMEELRRIISKMEELEEVRIGKLNKRKTKK